MYLNIYFPQGTIRTAMVVSDFNYTQVYYNDLAPAENSIRCTIQFNTTIANRIKQNINNKIKCVIKNDDDTNYFTGLLKSNVSFSKATVNGNISIEIVSPSALLEKQFATDKWFTNITLANAVTQLLEEVDIEDYTLSNLPNKTIQVLHLEKDEEVKSVLTELLYEYGYCFDFDNDGVFICNPLFDEAPATITNVFADGQTGNLIGNVQQTVQEKKYDGVSAEYEKLIQKNNQLIFDDASDHTLEGGKTLYDNESGTYTNYDCTVGEPFYIQTINDWKVGNDSFIISMANPETSYFKGTFTNYGKQGLLLVRNKLQTEQTVNKVQIWGSGFFIKETSYAKNSDGTNLDDIKLDYIFDDVNASAFADKLRKYYRYSNIKITLHSYSDFVYGAFCSVSVEGMGTIKGRIIQKRRTLESRLIEYTVEAVDEFQEANIKIETQVQSNTASAIQANIIKQVEPMVEQIVEPVVQTVIVKVYPMYKGKVSELPSDHSGYNKGDWIFLTVETDTEEIGLYKNSYDEDTEEYSWELITYEEDGFNDSYFNGACSDLLNYYTSELTEVGAYARAYINHLFVNKITIGENGSIQSANYSEENGTGFMLDSATGDIKANNGYFRGKTAKQILIAENVNTYSLDLNDYKDFLTHDRNNGNYELLNIGINDGIQRYSIYGKYHINPMTSVEYDEYILLADFVITKTDTTYGGMADFGHTQTYINEIKATGNFSDYVKITHHKGNPEDTNTFPNYCYWLYGKYYGEQKWYKNNTDQKIYLSKQQQELYICDYVTLDINLPHNMDIIAIKQDLL